MDATDELSSVDLDGLITELADTPMSQVVTESLQCEHSYAQKNNDEDVGSCDDKEDEEHQLVIDEAPQENFDVLMETNEEILHEVTAAEGSEDSQESKEDPSVQVAVQENIEDSLDQHVAPQQNVEKLSVETKSLIDDQDDRKIAKEPKVQPKFRKTRAALNSLSVTKSPPRRSLRTRLSLEHNEDKSRMTSTKRSRSRLSFEDCPLPSSRSLKRAKASTDFTAPSKASPKVPATLSKTKDSSKAAVTLAKASPKVKQSSEGAEASSKVPAISPKVKASPKSAAASSKSSPKVKAPPEAPAATFKVSAAPPKVQIIKTMMKRHSGMRAPCGTFTAAAKKARQDEEEGFYGFETPTVPQALPVKPVPLTVPQTLPVPSSGPFGNYQSICNIAFAKSRRGFLYKCLSGCRFQTLVKETLLAHLEKKHEKQEWNGFCNICSTRVSDKTGIKDEFTHMGEHEEAFGSDVVEVALQPTAPPSGRTNSITTVNTSVRSLPNGLKLPSGISVTSVTSGATSERSRDSIQLPKVPADDAKPLRPWLKGEKQNLKSNELAVLMQSKESLSATHKCMSSTCSFFTNVDDLFRNHLEFHEKSGDRPNFLKCSYCVFAAASVDELMEHVETHAYDRFQCCFCFYRTCNEVNVLTHQKAFHKDQRHAIIECPQLKLRDEPSKFVINSCRALNVQPLICVFCRGIFFTWNTFAAHLNTHQNRKARCIKCGKVTTNESVMTHIENCHRHGLYQCIYCVFGTHHFGILNNHIADSHPSEFPLFCEREELRNADGSLKHVSVNLSVTS